MTLKGMIQFLASHGRAYLYNIMQLKVRFRLAMDIGQAYFYRIMDLKGRFQCFISHGQTYFYNIRNLEVGSRVSLAMDRHTFTISWPSE